MEAIVIFAILGYVFYFLNHKKPGTTFCVEEQLDELENEIEELKEELEEVKTGKVIGVLDVIKNLNDVTALMISQKYPHGALEYMETNKEGYKKCHDAVAGKIIADHGTKLTRQESDQCLEYYGDILSNAFVLGLISKRPIEELMGTAIHLKEQKVQKETVA